MPFSRECAALHQLEGQLRAAIEQLEELSKQNRVEAESLKDVNVFDYSHTDFSYGWTASAANSYASAAATIGRILADVQKFHERRSA